MYFNIPSNASSPVQVFLITMLTVITWNQDSKQLRQCSRERSRIVREVITKKWLPIFDQHHVAISTECPFHLDRDYLWWPNDHKEGNGDKVDSHWTCPVCSRDFLCSESLTLHWDEVHREEHTDKYRDDVVCLAEYCDIFRCDVLIGHKRQQKRNQNIMGYLSFGEEDSSLKCEPSKMALLERSCHNVVRQCTINLEANVSEAQFSLVEQELIASLCSFLTCDHYNDDLFAEEGTSRKVPITLFTVLGATMACGFCVCYYLIWKFIQRGLGRIGKKLPIEPNKINKQSNKSLKLSFRESAKMVMRNSANIANSHTKSSNFFNNICEFSQEAKEDTIEFNNEFNANNTADYERKLRSISSIIEEEDEEKDDSERSISYASYPIVNRKFMVKQRSFEMTRSGLADHSVSRSSHGSLTPVSARSTPPMGSDGQLHRKAKAAQRPQSQEIYLHDLPMKVHPRYIQPLKHSYSDRYPCYSSTSAETTAPAMTKSRSYSHSQLRNAHNTVRTVFTRPKMPPPRQDSIEEEWEQKSQHSHSSMSLQSSISAVKSADANYKGRNTSKSSLSYNPSMHLNTNKEDHHREQSYPLYQSQAASYHQPFQHQQQQQQQQQQQHQQHQHPPQQYSQQQQHHMQLPQQQHHFSTSSKSNSNASITSRASLGSRVTATTSSQSFVKR